MCPFGPGRDVGRIDQASELRQVLSPPAVNAGHLDAIYERQGFRGLLTPATPVAIKRIHAVAHIDSRIHKCGAGQPVFVLEINDGGRTADRAPS